MAPFSFSRWLRSLFSPKKQRTYRRPPRRQLRVESLEDRITPSGNTDTWMGLGGDNNWKTTQNWSNGVPTNGMDLVFSGTQQQQSNNNLTGLIANSITFDGGGFDFTGNAITLANTISVNTQNASDTFDLVGITLAGPAGSLQYVTVNNGSTLTINSPLSGNTGSTLTKEGSGTLVLTADNSNFTGNFTVDNSAGVLQIQNANALGNTAGQTTTIGTSGQLQFSSAKGFTLSPNVTLILNGVGVIADGSLDNVAGNNTIPGTVTFDSDVYINTAAKTTLTITGSLGDLTAQNLTKIGDGTLVFASANSYHGTTTINDGILLLQNANGLGNTTSVTVNYNTTLKTFGTLQLDYTGTGTGFTIPAVPLFLNGVGFGGIGALDNLNGTNTWSGNITLASSASIGVEQDSGGGDNPLTVTGIVSGTGVLTKIGPSILIFPEDNTYGAGTVISTGTLVIEDSKGAGGGSITVDSGATLELAVDSQSDSVTHTTNTLYVLNTLNLNGQGVNSEGALYSNSGINVYAGTIELTSTAAIGVDPDPNPTASLAYFPTYSTASPYSAAKPGAVTGDYSLTIPGGLGAFSNELDKVGGGQLILPNASNGYTGNIHIFSGWITIQDQDALGTAILGTSQNGQATVTVNAGAALHLLPPADTSMTLHQNFVISGTGISHPFSLINNEGAILSLDGVNYIPGNITLAGQAGVGAQLLHPLNFPAGQLYITGEVFQKQATINVNANASGSAKAYPFPINTGTTSGGTLTVNAAVHGLADDVRIYIGDYDKDPTDAQLIYDSDSSGNYATSHDPSSKNGAVITVNYTLTSATINVVDQAILGDPAGSGYTDEGAGPVLVTYPQPVSGAYAAYIEIYVNQLGNSQKSTVWSLTAAVTPNAIAGGLVKLGSQAVILQEANGNYTGGVDIQQGVLVDQSPTGLGTSGTTTIESGASLLLANALTTSGFTKSGFAISNVNMVLNGAGGGPGGNNTLLVPNSTAGTSSNFSQVAAGPLAPLVVLDSTDLLNGASGLGNIFDDPTGTDPSSIIPSDFLWNGGISLANSVALDVQANSRLIVAGSVDDATNNTTGSSDLLKIDSGELELNGSNTYHGTTYVGTSGTSGTPGFDAEIPTQQFTVPSGSFTLQYGTGAGSTTGSLSSSDPNLGTDITNDLNGLSTIMGTGTVQATVSGGVVTVTFLGGLAAIQPATIQVQAGATTAATILQPGPGINEFFAGNSTFTNPVANGLPGGVLTVGNSQGLGAIGGGGVIVQNGSALQLQDNITIAGKSLTIAGSGVSAVGAPQTWFQDGPAPITGGQTLGTLSAVTGRITGIAPDPMDPTGQTIYVATAGGGAWKTTDGGLTWLPLFDAQGTAMYTGAIVAVRNNNSIFPIIYLGTGEADNSTDSFGGTGVYKSIDGGSTWTLLTQTGTNPNPLAGLAISQIVVDPNNTNLIYVATSDIVYNGSSGPAGIPTRLDGLTGGIDDVVGKPDGVGVWRYDGSKWFNLTDVVSANRSDDTTVVNTNLLPTSGGPGAPNSPGPDDNYLLSFPQQHATWSSIGLIDVSGDDVLYAALGTPDGRPVTTYQTFDNSSAVLVNYTNEPVNGVYFTLNPQTNTPIWYAGDGKTDGETVPTSSINANDFPFDKTAGTIKISVVPSTFAGTVIWAAAANATSGALDGVYEGTVAANGAITADGTTTRDLEWTAHSPSTNYMGNQGNYDNAILAVSSSVVYVGGESNVLIDNAGTWTDITKDTTGDAPAADFHAIAGPVPGTADIVFGSDGGLWSYNPTAKTWTDLNGTDLAVSLLNSISGTPASSITYYAGSQPSGVADTTGGDSWTMLYDNTGKLPFGGQVAVDPSTGDIFAWLASSEEVGNPIVTPAATLYESTDGGKTWTAVVGPSASTENPPLVIDPADSSGLRVLAGGNILWESLNGVTATLFSGPVTSIAVADYQGPFLVDPSFGDAINYGSTTDDPDVIYISNGTSLEVTEDHGGHWVNRNAGLNGINVADIEVDPRNAYTVYAVSNSAAGTGLGRVFVSTNAGRNWVNISTGLPDVPVWKLVIDPRNGNLYIGTDEGVYESTNGGANWSPLGIGVGMPDVSVRDLVLNTNTNTLTAATYGRSAFTLYLNNSQANEGAGALIALSGSIVWTGPVYLYGPTTLAADGNQALQNGRTTAILNIVGVVQDLGEDPGSPTASSNNITIGGAAIAGGTIVFSGTNIYGGTTDIKPGSVLVVNNLQALGVATNGTTVEAGGALDLQSSLAAEPVTLNGDGAYELNGHWTGALQNLSGSNTFTGTLILNSNTTIGVDTGSTLTIGDGTNGTITDDDNGYNLVKELTGTLALAGSDSYGGPAGGTFTTSSYVDGTGNPLPIADGTLVAQGVLSIQNDTGLGESSSNTTTTTVLDGAQLQIKGGITVDDENLRLTGSGILGGTGALMSTGGLNTWASTGSAAITLAQDKAFSPVSTPPATVTINVLATNAGDGLILQVPIVDGALTEGITKIGQGILILDDNGLSHNSYKGLTTVANGIVRIQTATALGNTIGGTVVNAGAALQIDGDPTNVGNSITVGAEALTINGTGVGNAGALENYSGNNTLNGTITLGNVSTATGTGTAQTDDIGADAGTQLTINGIVRDPTGVLPPVANLTKVGNGTVILAADNSYTGLTTVSAGVLEATASSTTSGTIESPLGAVVNQKETVTLSGPQTGSFSLSFKNPITGTTSSTAFQSASPTTTTATALQNLLTSNTLFPAIGSTNSIGNVTVGLSGSTYTITFVNALAGQLMPAFTGTGLSGTTVAVAIAVDGSQGTVVSSGATLQVAGNSSISSEALTLNGLGFNNEGALDSPSGNNTWGNNITLGSNANIGADGSSKLSVTAPIGDGGKAFSVTKVGTGTLDYQAANTYTGLTTVNQGTLLLDDSTGDPIAGALTIGTGASNNVNNAVAQWQHANQIPSGKTVTVKSDGTANLNGVATETISTLNIADGLVTTGNSGSTNLTIGSLSMTGGTIDAVTAGSQVSLTGNVTAASDSSGNPATIEGAGTLALGNAARTFNVAGPTFVSPAVADLVISTPISGTVAAGSNQLTKSGSGTMQLTADNTFAGITTINQGTVLADGPNTGNTLQAVWLNGATAVIGGTGTVGLITPKVSLPGGTTLPLATPVSGEIAPPTDPSGNTSPTLTTSVSQEEVWSNATTFYVSLNNANENDGSSSQLIVNDTTGSLTNALNINGATIAGVVDPLVFPGESFVVIKSNSPIEGQFAEASGWATDTVFIDGAKFGVNYDDTTTDLGYHDVTLTRELNVVTVTLASSQNPSVYGQSVVFTATVTPESGATFTPGTTEYVTFTFDKSNHYSFSYTPGDDGYLTGSFSSAAIALTVGSNGVGTAQFDPQDSNLGGNGFSWPPTAGTPYTIDAAFNDGDQDANFVTDIATWTETPAQTVQQTVNKDGTSIATSIDPGSTSTPVPDEPVVLDVTITPSPLATTPPTALPQTPSQSYPSGSVYFLMDKGNISGVNSTGSPIVITSAGNGLTDGERIQISGATGTIGAVINNTTSAVTTGNPAYWYVHVLTANTFALYQDAAFTMPVSGSGTYGGGGTFAKLYISSSLSTQGTATVTIPASDLKVGSHTVSAYYVGDSNYKGIATLNSQALTITVAKLPPILTVTVAPVSATEPVYAEPLNLTATVAGQDPNAPIPTGTVTFYGGPANSVSKTQQYFLGNANLSGGVATLNVLPSTTTPLPVGLDEVFAVYNGTSDPSYVSETSAGNISDTSILTTGGPIVITSATHTLVSDEQVVIFGSSLAAANNTALNPTWTITVIDANHFSLNGSSGTVADYGTGGHWTIAAPFTVYQAGTQTTMVLSSPNPSAYGKSVILSASVSVVSPAQGTPSGIVSFFDNGTLLGAGQLQNMSGNEIATYTTTKLSIGTHDNITAIYNYSGGGTVNPSFQSSTSDALSPAQVVQVGSSLALSSSANPAVWGQPVTFTLTVTAAIAGLTATAPTGTVTFSDTFNGGTNTLLGTVNYSTVGSSYIATYTTSSLAVGSHSISASYSGDGTYLTNSITMTAVEKVNAAKTSTQAFVSGASNPSSFGQALTLSASVSVTGSGSGSLDGDYVTFYYDAINTAHRLGEAQLSGGIATLSNPVTSLPASTTTHTIYAVFNDSTDVPSVMLDPNFATSTGTTTQTVNKQSTSTAISTAGSTTIQYSQSQTFTAVVTPTLSTTTTPTGTVTFSYTPAGSNTHTTISGTVNYSSSGNDLIATLATGALPAGSLSITAAYSGDTNYSLSNSSSNSDSSVASVAMTVNKGDTGTTVAGSPSPSAKGSAVTLKATVTATDSGATLPPSGTVTFSYTPSGSSTATTISGTVSYTTDSADLELIATITTTALPLAGAATPLTITATYKPTTNFVTSSGTTTQTVLNADTTKLTVSPATAVAGTDLTFTATVTASVSPKPTGDGSITGVIFYDGSATTGTQLNSTPVALNSSGVAKIDTNTLGVSLSVGPHTITAVYTGDNNYVSTQGTATIRVTDTTTTNLTVTDNNPVYSETVTFSATVSPAHSGGVNPTGTVAFFDGSTKIATANVTPATGVATYSTSTLSIASHKITAKYSGDSNYGASPASNTQTVTVQKGISVTTVTSSVNPSFIGQPVKLTATVTDNAPGSNAPVPTGGTVTFWLGGTAPGVGNGGTLLGSATLSAGKASITVPFNTTLSAVPIYASWAGNAYYLATNPADSTTFVSVSQTVNAQSPFSLSASLLTSQVYTNTALAIQVTVEDSAGNQVWADSGTVSFTLNGKQYSGQMVHGVITFSNLTVPSAITYSTTITDTTDSLSTPLSFTAQTPSSSGGGRVK